MALVNFASTQPGPESGFLAPYEAAAEQLPDAAEAFGKELWQHPWDTAERIAMDVGTSAACGAALSYFLPARGPVALAIGVAMTAPLLIKGIGSLVDAHEEASLPGANVQQIGRHLADSTVSNGFDVGLTFLGGWGGARAAHAVAESDTAAGAFSRKTRTKILGYENKALVMGKGALDYFKPSNLFPPDSTLAVVAPDVAAAGATAKRPLHVNTPKSLADNMSAPRRLGAAYSMRISQASQTPQDVAGLQPYNILMHAHTILSDGDAKPAAIYQLAQEKGYDGALTSEHDHILARAGEKPTDERVDAQKGTPIVGSDPQELQTQRAAAAAASVPGKFFADGGQEIGVIGKLPPQLDASGKQIPRGANHTGIYNDPAYVRSNEPQRGGGSSGGFVGAIRRALGFQPRADAPISIQDIPDGRFDLVQQYLDAHGDPNSPTVAILNHPRETQDFSAKVAKNLQGHDYGMSLYPTFQDWLANWGDKYVRGIEVVKGGALTPTPIAVIPPQFYNITDAQILWDKGFHGGVSAGPDIHFQARVGEPPLATTILASSLDRTGVYEALNARRMSVTSNFQKLTAYMTANDGQFMMGNILDGSVVPSAGLTPEVHIGGTIDPAAKYTVKIFQDAQVGDGQLAAAVQQQSLTGAQLQAMNNVVKFNPVQPKLGSQSLFYADIQRTDAASPSFGEIVGTAQRNFDGTPSNVTINAHGTFVRGMVDHIEYGDGPATIDYATTPASPELAEAAATNPSTAYPERAITSPIFIDPPSGGTHSLFMTAVPGATTIISSGAFAPARPTAVASTLAAAQQGELQ